VVGGEAKEEGGIRACRNLSAVFGLHFVDSDIP
jgi:hypothetical protein